MEAETPIIRPWQAYSAKEAAVILGLSTDSLYRIDERELPRRRTGPNRGTVRYLGVDILTYMAGDEPLDFAAELEAARDDLRAALTNHPARPAVQALPVKGKKRVL